MLHATLPGQRSTAYSAKPRAQSGALEVRALLRKVLLLLRRRAPLVDAHLQWHAQSRPDALGRSQVEPLCAEQSRRSRLATLSRPLRACANGDTSPTELRGGGEPSPGADVLRGQAQSRRRCGPNVLTCSACDAAAKACCASSAIARYLPREQCTVARLHEPLRCALHVAW